MLVPILLALAALQVSAVPATQPSQSVARNPIVPGAADPDAVVVGKTVWMYPTYSAKRGENAFYAFSSTDLVHWQRHGPVLDFAGIAWIWSDGNKHHYPWAPCMIEHGGKFYFYYSVGDQDVTPSRIGVAVADSPAGPFKDSGKPLVNDGAKGVFEAIDPTVFTDPKDGASYLYAGGSNGAKLRVWKLKADMMSIDHECQVPTPPQFTEGAFLHERGGKYYLSYSHGYWRDATYSVHYAVGPSPLGPFEYKGAILVSNERHKGPGHHSFIESAIGQWYIVYHRWNARRDNGPFNGSRSVCIDKLEYNGDGTIKPIVMTDTVAADSFGTK